MKKILSVFMALAIIFTSAFTEIPLTAVTAQAATSVTVDEAVAWIKARGDEGWCVDVDGVYGCQCVDLIYAYYQYLGYPVPGGNAYAYAESNNFGLADSGWYKDTIPSPGAIVAWPANVNAAPNWPVGEFGHVGLVYAVDGATIYTVETNTAGVSKATYRQKVAQNATYIHPAFSEITPNPTPDVPHEDQSVLAYNSLSDGTLEVYCPEANRADLKSIVIPSTYNGKTVSKIADEAFKKCTNLTSVSIPNSVTSIGGMAFYNCTSLKSIKIPNSVTSIGNYAFVYCTSLTSVTIPNSVTSIGISAFNRTSLTSVTIPNSVTSIGDYAFHKCTSLTSVTIPNSVTSIYTGAFSGCTSLTTINVDFQNKNYCDVNGVLFNKDKTKLVQYPAGKKEKSYTIPNSVTSIDEEAFSGCPNLTSVTIPNSVTSIDGYAFFDCTSLTSVTIPNSVTSIGVFAFGYCESLTSVTIPNSVTSIDNSAFRGCTSLTNVYYTGTESEWSKISIGDGNDPLINAKKTFNPAKPTAVTGLKATSTSDSVTLTWNKNSAADSYKIKQVVNGQLKELTKTTSNATTSYTIKNLSPNTSYEFKVYAFKGTQYSEAAAITVKTAAAKPTAVTNLKATSTSNSVTLTWDKNSAADSYKVKQIVNGTAKELVKTTSNATTSYTIKNLSPNTSYEFKVYAFKGTQYSEAAAITVKTTAAKPSAVTGLKATSTSNSVTLTWDKNSAADSYKVKQVVNGQLKELVKTTSNATTSYTIENLSPNTSYEFKVYAFKGTQYSEAAAITVKTTAAKPSAVTGLKATSTSNSVTLTWDKNSAADSYKVKQIVNGQLKELVKTTSNATTSYTIKNLSPNTSYEFKVYAFKGTQYSEAATITVKTAAEKPTAVTNLKGTATRNTITLNWDKNSGADSYKVKQIVNGQLKELVKISGNSTTTYVVTGLDPNTTYEFAVYAFKGTEYSTAAKITVKTAAEKPTAVTNLKATSTSNTVTLTWTKNSAADSYKVKQIVNGQLKELVKISGNSTTTYVVTGLDPNTTYEFAVYAFKGTEYSTAAKITVSTKS